MAEFADTSKPAVAQRLKSRLPRHKARLRGLISRSAKADLALFQPRLQSPGARRLVPGDSAALIRRWSLRVGAVVLGIFAIGGVMLGALGTPSHSLPEGPGLAAKYPRDRGIGRDPRVLLAEDFEATTIEAIGKRWEDVSNQGGKVLALSRDVPKASGGRQSLQMTATLGQNTGGHLYRRLPREVERVFARFYVKFAPDAEYIHHFVHLGGYHPSTPYPQGGAGERPRGDERITVGIEPAGEYGRYPAPGAWNFYTYWHEMKVSADNRYWGNGLHPVRPALVPRDRWQCVEAMLRLNSTPEQPDGELALWLDGRPVAHFARGVRRGPWSGMGFTLAKEGGEPFEGFRWRTSNALKVNFFWLLHYVTENAARQNRVPRPRAVNRVWFDDIIVSTEYVGPISAARGST